MSDARDPGPAAATPTTAEVDDLVGTVVAGRYHVLRRLAEGGMGVVYEARQEPLSRRVALKFIRGDAARDPVARQRFEREARAASALSEPHVVVVHDFGVVDVPGSTSSGGLYLAMEFVEGDNLRAVLSVWGRLSWARSLAIVTQVAQALAAAHARGMVHRDLKPENVMLARSDSTPGSASPRVKVLDFGLAKMVDERLLRPGAGNLTGSGGFVGTPGYISPEHIDGAAEDPRQDVYSLGVLWWEMLTGSHPFPADTPMKMLLRQMHEDPPPPDWLLQHVEGIPPAGARLLHACLAKTPGERPRDGGALLQGLLSLGGGGAGTPLAVVGGGVLQTPLGIGSMGSVDFDAATLAARRSAVHAVGQAPLPPPPAPADRTTKNARPPHSAPTPTLTEATLAQTDVALAASSLSSSSPVAAAPVGGRGRAAAALVALGAVLFAVGAGGVWWRHRLAADGVAANGGAHVEGAANVDVVVQDTGRAPHTPPPVYETHVFVGGVTSFVALKELRDALPEHALRHYRSGRADLVFVGDVGVALADRLLSFSSPEQTWMLDIVEVDRGRLKVEVVPWAPRDDAAIDAAVADAAAGSDAGPAPRPGDGIDPSLLVPLGQPDGLAP